MKILKNFVLILIILISLGFSQSVFAISAKVTITVATLEGKKISGAPIMCWAQPPPNNGWPAYPIWTYLISDSNGQAIWTVETKPNHTYKCSTRSAMTTDYCYRLSGSKTYNFDSDPNDTLFITATASGDKRCPQNSGSAATSTSSPLATAAAVPAVTAPVAEIKVTSIKVNGKDVATPDEPTSSIDAAQGTKIQLKGTSTAVTTVIVKVFSETKTYSSAVDTGGSWAVNIPTAGLSEGLHKIEISAEGTDKVFLTYLLALKAPQLETNTAIKTSYKPFYISILLAILAASIFTIGLIKRLALAQSAKNFAQKFKILISKLKSKKPPKSDNLL